MRVVNTRVYTRNRRAYLEPVLDQNELLFVGNGRYPERSVIILSLPRAFEIFRSAGMLDDVEDLDRAYLDVKEGLSKRQSLIRRQRHES